MFLGSESTLTASDTPPSFMASERNFRIQVDVMSRFARVVSVPGLGRSPV
jgi:hypothetical protein